MRQLVTVFLRKDAFLMHPNSQQGERGVWLAHQPGVGVSSEASDSVLGDLVLMLKTHSKQGLPPQDLQAGAPFPLASIAGVNSWGVLSRSSPVMAHVTFGSTAIEIKKNVIDGRGYSPAEDTPVVLPASATPSEIGSALRGIFADDA